MDLQKLDVLFNLGIKVSSSKSEQGEDDFIVALRSSFPSPSLSFSHSSNLVSLHYPGPQGFGQQHFTFDPNLFIIAYDSAKFSPNRNDTFESLFFDVSYPKANNSVRLIFKLFLINPSVVRKSAHLNTNIRRRLILSPSRSDVFAFLGVHNPKRTRCRPQKPVNKRDLLSPGIICQFVPESLLNDAISLCNQLDDVVSNSASLFDLSLFDDYLTIFNRLRSLASLKPLSPSASKKLFSNFSNLVHSHQA